MVSLILSFYPTTLRVCGRLPSMKHLEVNGCFENRQVCAYHLPPSHKVKKRVFHDIS